MNICVSNGEAVQFELRSAWEGEVQENVPFTGEFLSKWITVQNGTPVLLMGLGKRAELDRKRARRAAAKGVSALIEIEVSTIGIDVTPILDALGEGSLRAVAESALLALYRLPGWHFEEKARRETALFIKGAEETADAQEQLEEARRLAEQVCRARDLVNAPSNLLYPQTMADEMVRFGQKAGLSMSVLDEKQAAELGMEAFLTVGKDAAQPPRLIVARYDGDPESSERIALVGKGITCDTGGYCLKPASSMGGIKGDMAGAAAVFCALCALAENGARVNATVVIPAAENRIAPGSFLPGDVIGSMSGKKIEIGNTDAEGRLVLADAVTYAIRREHATAVLDIATLTGAVVSMFGFTTAGLLCDDEEMCADFLWAAELSDEQYWRLPIFPEYERMIDGKLSDVSNVSTDGCGTITAGLFIRRFAEGLPWMHLDIAGTAWTDPPRWEYQSKGATGAGVTTIYHFCRRWGEAHRNSAQSGAGN